MSVAQSARRDLAVVIDHSGSMSGDNKMGYAKTGVNLLIDAMTAEDTLTLIAFDDQVVTLSGPGKVDDKAALSMPSPADGGASGRRRGGRAAILADLKLVGMPQIDGKHDVATLHLTYRSPGSMKTESQDVTVSFTGMPGVSPKGGYYSDAAVEKNTIILDFYLAFHDATALAQTDHVAARKVLTDFQPKITERLQGWPDEDLLDDLKILQQFIDVLQ